MVQRLLATKSEAGGARALIGSAWSNIPITILFLAIGTGLAYFYSQGAAYDISDSARIFPLFAFNELPAGLRGLVFAGLFAAAMSSLDSAICAIGATLVSDIAPKRVPRSATRWLSALVGLLLVVVAWWMQSAAEGALSRGLSLVEFALSAMTVIYGGLLGVFALGWVHPRRGSDLSVQLGLGFGAVTGLALFLQGPLGVPSELQLAWPWWIPTSACVAFAIAALGSSSSTAQSGLGEQEQAHG